MDTEAKPRLTMREYTIDVVVVNPAYLVALGEPAYTRERRTIKGYTLEDAKRRNGIE
jgi:hypothetical protein